MPIPNTVSRLMNHATMRITHPAATLLELADRLTTPGSDEPAPPGSQRKLQDTDAFAVLEAVTRMMRRHDLSPSLVCEAAKVANHAKDFYKFHLTQTEMDETGRLVAELKSGRRVHRGLAPYLRMVRRIAAESGVPEADLLEELGAAIPDFLAPFAAVDRDVWETVFDDIALLAAHALDAPIAVINLIASDRQWFKAQVGLGVREMPLDVSICADLLDLRTRSNAL